MDILVYRPVLFHLLKNLCIMTPNLNILNTVILQMEVMEVTWSFETVTGGSSDFEGAPSLLRFFAYTLLFAH